MHPARLHFLVEFDVHRIFDEKLQIDQAAQRAYHRLTKRPVPRFVHFMEIDDQMQAPQASQLQIPATIEEMLATSGSIERERIRAP